VPLSAMKAEPKLAGMAMFRQFRLSVSPVTEEEWKVIQDMAK
jgi:predicted RNA-binding protein with PUA-like domain